MLTYQFKLRRVYTVMFATAIHTSQFCLYLKSEKIHFDLAM